MTQPAPAAPVPPPSAEDMARDLAADLERLEPEHIDGLVGEWILQNALEGWPAAIRRAAAAEWLAADRADAVASMARERLATEARLAAAEARVRELEARLDEQAARIKGQAELLFRYALSTDPGPA